MTITTSRDGTRVGYDVHSEGPLGVILVHGWSCSGRTWDAVLSELQKEGRQFVTVDLRGHGASTGDGLDHSVERYAEDVLAAADAVGFDRFVTIGHSMGAKYAQYLRVIARERIIAQVAIAPTPSTTVEEEAKDETIAAMASNAGDPEKFIGVLAYITKEPLPDEVARPLAEESATLTAEVLAASMRAFARTDFTEDLLAAGAAPRTLVVGGSADPIYHPDRLKERIAIETSGAALRIVDAGHDPLHECPRSVALIIDEFLTDVEAGLR